MTAIPSGASAAGSLSWLLCNLENGQAEPGVCTAGANLARALATLADAIAELEARAGIADRGSA